MNMYKAILAAADHIKAHPDMYIFARVHVPPDCGTPGCALGWINYFSGTARIYYVFPMINARALGFTESSAFYLAMDAVSPDVSRWRQDAPTCAATLRQLAKRFLPAKVPDWDAMSAKRTVLPDVISEEVDHAGL